MISPVAQNKFKSLKDLNNKESLYVPDVITMNKHNMLGFSSDFKYVIPQFSKINLLG